MFSRFAFSGPVLASQESLESVGIELCFLFKNLTALQNSLGFLGFNLLKKVDLAWRISLTSLFRADLYLVKSPDLLALLYRRFLFFIDVTSFLFSQGKFFRLGSLLLGMHSSIIDINLLCQLVHDTSILSSDKDSQSTLSKRSPALSQSAWLYSHTVRPFE